MQRGFKRLRQRRRHPQTRIGGAWVLPAPQKGACMPCCGIDRPCVRALQQDLKSEKKCKQRRPRKRSRRGAARDPSNQHHAANTIFKLSRLRGKRSLRPLPSQQRGRPQARLTHKIKQAGKADRNETSVDRRCSRRRRASLAVDPNFNRGPSCGPSWV